MKTLFLSASLALSYFFSLAQHTGNKVYGNNYDYYGGNNGSNKGNNSVYHPNDSVYITDAKVMINLVPDAYVVVYGIQQEAKTVAECNKNMAVRIEKFKAALKTIGLSENDVFVDMVAQARIYDYKIDNNTATQFQQGFELKKNIIIKFTQNSMMEKINLLAADQEIFDIVKVDYLINDIEKVQNVLREAALKIIENKKDFAAKNSSLDLKDKGIIFYENFNTVYPDESYRKYTAFEESDARYNYNNTQAWIKDQRKSQTFYFDKVNPSHFDKVINHDMISVPIQMSLELGIKYYIGKPQRKTRK